MDAKNTNTTEKKTKLERLEERIAELENRKKLSKPAKMRKREKEKRTNQEAHPDRSYCH